MFCPSAELFEVLVDATIGGEQHVVSVTASLQTLEIVLVDEVMNQAVPKQHQFSKFIFCPGEIYVG